MSPGGSPDSGSSGPIDWQGPGAPEGATAADGPPGPADPPTPDDGGNGVATDPAPIVDDGADGPGPAVLPDDEAPGDGPGEVDDASADSSDDPSGVDPERSVEAERDDYLDRLQRLQAEFENYRRRMTREQAEAITRGSQALAAELLPVLDGCEAAVQQGQAEVEPIRNQLVELLTKAGLERNGEPGDAFDPEMHDAVMHEPAEDGEDGSVIAEVLRTGYSWKGRVLRPAMVKVRG